MKKALIFILTILVGLAACTGDDKKFEPIGSDFIYSDYQIRAQENREAVTIRIQFRRGKNGSTLALKPPAKVELDGEALQPDSIGKIGFFYEVQKRLDEFTGSHTITFWSEKEEQQQQVFNFTPFTITALPSELKREDIILEINNLQDETPVHIILTDTSFNSNDINQIDTVRKGQIVLPKEKLNALKNGPVHLQLIHNNEQYVKDGARRTGQLTLSYSLQREFYLKD